MIDPIGLLGTLIAIVQVCNKVVSVCYEYRSAIKDAPHDIARVLDEVANVRNIAERLIRIAEVGQTASLESIDGPNSPLRQYLFELIDLKKSLKLEKKQGLRSTLLWPLRRSDVEKRLVAIQRIKATFQLALSADNAHNIVEVLNNTRSLPLIKDEVKKISEHIDQKNEDESKAHFLHQLGWNDQSPKHRDEYKKCVEGTGDWLLQHETFLDWKVNPGKLLWLNGHAGCGKTVLCANVIENLAIDRDNNENIGLAYFYIDGSGPLDSDSLYSSLTSQLISQRGSMLDYIQGNRHHFQRRERTGWHIPTRAWVRMLREIIELFDSVYIVLDALDESEESIGVEGVMDFISTVFEQSRSQVHMIAFSRDLESIRNNFKELRAVSIAVSGRDLDHDLKTALHIQLLYQRKFSRWPKSLKKTIEESLLAQANGSFRWLDCQLQTLKTCATPLAVKRVLSDLPKSLEVYYTRILEAIDESNQQPVYNLLRWIAFAFRLISVNDVANAIAMNDEGVGFPFFDEHLELLDVEGFMDSCSSLVSTYSAITDKDGNQEVYVKLAHFSVREFLISDSIRSGPCSRFAMEKSLVHSYLAKSCLSYFHYSISSPDDISDLSTLSGYCGHFWLKHKAASGQDWASEPLDTLLLDMYDESQPYFKKWMQVASIDKPWLEEDCQEVLHYSPLYCAAYSGLPQVTRVLLDRGAPTNDRGGMYGHPLQAAAFKGSLETVVILIDAKADVDTERGSYKSALAAAAANGHTEVARALINAGASVNGTERYFDHKFTPLFLAASNGHLEMVELLLEHGAKDGFRMKATPGSALHAAAASGRLDIVKSLLKYQHIKDTNDRCHSGIVRPHASGFAASQYTAAAAGHIDILHELLKHGISKEETLRYAARAGDKALVMDLLDQGIPIDAPGFVSDHPMALQSAARGGHVAIVRELLSRGADPNDNSGWSSPLLGAITSGNVEILQMLIDAGAEVNPEYSCPLDHTISADRDDMAEILVKHGANAHKGVRRAAIRGDFKAFILLVKLGGDIRAELSDYTHIVQAAARGGSVRIMRQLLDQGMEAEPNIAGHTTPLMEALRSDHPKVAELLLDHGANVKAPPPAHLDNPAPQGDSYYDGHVWPPPPADETPLTTAIANNYRDIARRIMSLGAAVMPDTPDTTGTPLLYAAWEQFSDLVRDLLERGANPNQRGTVLKREKLTFPLLLAIEKGNVDIINQLINAGAKVDDQDIEGFSPLHVAAANKNPEVLRILIQDHHPSITPTLLNGSQPIHSAASRGTAEHVKILLDSGAAVDCKNNEGRTPLHWAANGACWDSVELLLDQGADASIKSDESGPNTALDLAHLAREKPDWQKRDDIVENWDDERVEKLLQRLKQATMG
ncbi:ankyrin repeat-containing domain protein [Ilyonectria destructans]|nr:ankyrin repeat-containing domain protein [Ilyonectria destructans]